MHVIYVGENLPEFSHGLLLIYKLWLREHCHKHFQSARKHVPCDIAGDRAEVVTAMPSRADLLIKKADV